MAESQLLRARHANIIIAQHDGVLKLSSPEHDVFWQRPGAGSWYLLLRGTMLSLHQPLLIRFWDFEYSFEPVLTPAQRRLVEHMHAPAAAGGLQLGAQQW